METIFGEGWRVNYITKDGKLVGMKYHGPAKHMKGAIDTLYKKLKEYQSC